MFWLLFWLVAVEPPGRLGLDYIQKSARMSAFFGRLVVLSGYQAAPINAVAKSLTLVVVNDPNTVPTPV